MPSVKAASHRDPEKQAILFAQVRKVMHDENLSAPCMAAIEGKAVLSHKIGLSYAHMSHSISPFCVLFSSQKRG